MNYTIYIRPLVESDAETSYRWRNDSEVWKHTLSRPDGEITLEIEKEWIQKVLTRADEKRFAICIKETDEYIGNVQLTGIDFYEAEFHIFIGEKKFWGKGLGVAATNLAVEYAFKNLNLQCVYLYVKKSNTVAVRTYEKAGFKVIHSGESGNIRLAKYHSDLKENKTVSVFVMAYNHGKFIAQAIEGILLQKTDFDIEIVIGEDNSTDNTKSIILDYARKFPDKFKLILHEENIGAGNNQISVLNACNGKYIAMCEGDDYWTDPLKLQKQIDFLEANPEFAICFHRVKVVHEDGKTEPHSSDLLEKDVTTFEDLADGNYILTQSNVFRNRLYAELPPWFKEMPAGDYILHLLNAQHGKIKFLADEMAVYRVHSGGIWSSKNALELHSEWARELETCRDYFAPRGGTGFTKQLADSYREICFANFDAGDYAEFRRNYAKLRKIFKHLNRQVRTALVVRYALSFAPQAAARYKAMRSGASV